MSTEQFVQVPSRWASTVNPESQKLCGGQHCLIIVGIQLAPSGLYGAHHDTLAFVCFTLRLFKDLSQAGAFGRSRLLIEQSSGEDINVTLLSPSVRRSWHLNMESKCKMSGNFLC